MSDFTDALINKLTPDAQIAPLISPNDSIAESEMVYAEQLGQKLVEHTDGDVLGAAPVNFQDTTNSPFSIADIGRYIVIRSGANIGTYRVSVFNSASSVDCEETDGSAPVFVNQTTIDYAIHEEPSLEGSINYALTQLKQIVDPSSDWFQDMPRAFDPTDTDGGSTANEKMSLKVLADNWYGKHTKITDIVTPSFAVSDTDTGSLFLTSLTYADDADRRGLIIQASTGAYHDEVALASITLGLHKVTLVDVTTGNEFFNAAGNLVYGVLQDGADNSGTGEGTDVFIKFVEDVAGVPTAYTWVAATDPANVQAYLPDRKRRTEMTEYDERRFMIAGIVGDAEQAQDISEIRSALGLSDGEDAGDWDLTNTTASFPFSELTLGTATMEDIVNKLNEEIGSRVYTEDNFLTDGETITESLDAIDQALGSVGSLKSKIVERVTVDIAKGAAHTLPFATGSDALITTYLLDTGDRGLNMDVYVAGKKLVPDSAAGSDGEYEETSNTQVTFRFKVKAGQIIEYVIKDDA